MTAGVVDRRGLTDFLIRLDHHYGQPGRALLVGETSQLLEGWRPWISLIELTVESGPGSPDGPDLDSEWAVRAVDRAAAELDVPVFLESPGDVIPLPDGWRERARPAAAPTEWLEVFHFDAYSVAFRYIARGDEPDYHLVLRYLEQGWIEEEVMERLLESTIPRFNADTIAQDPAEFRRRYKGLMQMWHAVRPGVVHRPTEA